MVTWLNCFKLLAVGYWQRATFLIHGSNVLILDTCVCSGLATRYSLFTTFPVSLLTTHDSLLISRLLQISLFYFLQIFLLVCCPEFS
jgi:hypothetical protein